MAVEVSGAQAPSSTGATSSHEKLQRWAKRLGTLPSLALPTDYPRPSTSHLS
jgi:L-aminoadipate-semialdehyde dehydrogenase